MIFSSQRQAPGVAELRALEEEVTLETWARETQRTQGLTGPLRLRSLSSGSAFSPIFQTFYS